MTKKDVWSNKRKTKEHQNKFTKKSADTASDKGWSPDRKGYIIDGIDGFVPRQSENALKIVEPLEYDDMADYKFPVHFHRDVGFNNDIYLCLHRMFNSPCSICAKQTSELWDDDPDLAKTFYPDDRWLMWVLDLKSDTPDKLLLWSCSKTLAKNIVAISKEPGSSVYKDPSDPVDGAIIHFEREGKGFKDTKFLGLKLGKPYPISEEVADQRRLFQDILIIPSPEEVAEADGGKIDGGETYDSSGEDTPEPETDDVVEEIIDDLGGLNRAELKDLVPGGGVVGSEFVVYRTTTDDEIRNYLREIAEPEPEEPEPEEPEPEEPEPPKKSGRIRSGDSGGPESSSADKKETIKNQLKKRMAERKKNKAK